MEQIDPKQLKKVERGAFIWEMNNRYSFHEDPSTIKFYKDQLLYNKDGEGIARITHVIPGISKHGDAVKVVFVTTDPRGLPDTEMDLYVEREGSIPSDLKPAAMPLNEWIDKVKYQTEYIPAGWDKRDTSSTITDLKTQEALFIDFTEKMRSIIFKKGNDYSEGGLDESSDRLSNFKLAGSICGLTAEQNCLSLIATKISRIGVLLKKSTADNESLEDSLLDGANYFFLLYCLRMEKIK